MIIDCSQNAPRMCRATTRPRADICCSGRTSPVRRQRRGQVSGSEKACSARSARTRRTQAGNGAGDRGADYGTVGVLQANCDGVDCSGVSVKHSTSPIAASDRDESSARKCFRIWSAASVTEVAGVAPPRFCQSSSTCSSAPRSELARCRWLSVISLVRGVPKPGASPEKLWHSSTVLILL